jgi:glycosyltransferase involved in cell wall biosynthesis
MRLLLVTDSYPPLVGGADFQTQALARAMQAAGHEVTVATPWQPGLAETESDGGVLVRRTRALTMRVPWFSKDPGRRHHPPFPDPGTVIGLRRIIRSFRPDLVHAYGWVSYSAAVALWRTRTPTIVSARDYGYVCPIRTYLYHEGRICSGPAPLKCLRCATITYTRDEAGNATLGRQAGRVGSRHRLRGLGKALVAVAMAFGGRPLLRRDMVGLHSVSQFVRQVMDRHLIGSRGRPIIDVVIPSFLIPPLGSPDPAMLARLPEEPFLLFVGALLPEKGIWPLLAAYERIRRPAPPLVLIGAASYKSPDQLPDGVIHLGQTSHATVLGAWDRALFGVVPSVGAETFGNVVTEAMSRGRPVIGSRAGGIVDIIEEGVSGLLVPPGDVDALTAAMQRLIDDSALRARLGHGARRRAGAFSAARVVPQFEAVYVEAARAGKRGS